MTTATETMCTEEYDPITQEDLDDPFEGEELPPDGFEPEQAESALAALKPELMAIPADEVRSFYVGATPAVGLGLAYAEAFAEDRERFDHAFKPEEFDPAEYDMGQRSMAFWQADIQMRQQLNADGPFRLLVLEAKPLRRKLLKNITFLWGEDPVLGDTVAAIRKGQGYQDMADDLGAMHELFTENWDRAEGKCEVTVDEVERAKVLGAAMLQALSPTSSEELSEARDLRNRAAEYLHRGFEEVRAAAQYVFRNDEARLERYPSMYVLRYTRRSSDAAVEAEGENPAQTAEQEPAGEEALAADA